jgi:hypothetical protein
MERAFEMKTKTLIACLTTGLLTAGAAVRAADQQAIPASNTSSFEHRHHAPEPHWFAALGARNASGVIPRVIRSGDPLQMLNVRAPAKYGTAEENVVWDPEVPGRGNGIKLLGISF